MLISKVETLFLTFKGKVLSEKAWKMFEEMASSAVKMLIFLFWTTIAFAIIWGALWLKSYRKAK
ncbi:MAG: hypothetical protein QXL57_07585 [Candidatus Bathyarchaeia archaeon]